MKPMQELKFENLEMKELEEWKLEVIGKYISKYGWFSFTMLRCMGYESTWAQVKINKCL